MDAPGADAEQAVFKKLKKAFRGDNDGIGFYRFPIVDKAGRRFDREPDFLILHKEYGLIVIEVKGYKIEHIDEIIGQSWRLQGISQDESQPYSQAREQAFFIQSHFQREQTLRDERGNCLIPVHPLVALPNISQNEWEESGFDSNPSQRVMVSEDLTLTKLQQKLESLPETDTLKEETYRAARAVLTGGEVISGDRGDINADPVTKSEYYQQVERGLSSLDEEQENLGIATPDGPQQIRGIAGSGKTVLLAMKAAAFHIRNPERRIAVTFNTRSLYDTIESLVDRFVAHFSGGESGENLEILHGWGGTTQHGLYYKIAQEAGLSPRSVQSAEDKFGTDLSPNEMLAAACQEVVENGNIQESYDAIFIDEGQDFEPGFYKMCFHALTKEKRLIWAYDEAQNLTSLTAPTPSQIFGADQDILPDKLDLRGSYEGNIPKSRVMRRSYRAPRQALMVAHTVGMALKNPELPIPRITRKSGWNDIGYEVEGDFRSVGETIELSRPEQFSPHPLQGETEAGPFMTFEQLGSRDDEIVHVAASISKDIKSEDLAPDDILLIPLGTPQQSREIGQQVATELEERDIETNLAWEGNKNVFAQQGQVTISRINRAKGNEAAQVYVMNVEASERDTWDANPVTIRNELFVALTRTRGWCTITGVEQKESLFEEIKSAIEESTGPDPVITFPAPRQRDTDINTTVLPGSQKEIGEYGERDQTRDQETEAGDVKTETRDGGPATEKIYLGAGAELDGWVPLPLEVIESKITPLVIEYDAEDMADPGDTIQVNFTSKVSVSGWTEVDADVVNSDILPIVENNRTDTGE